MDDPGFVDSIGRLIQILFDNLGPDRTIGLVILLLVAFGLRRWYLDYRAGQAVNQALEEKERSIQRLNGQEREWRLYFLIQSGMSQEDAERIVLRNDFSTPAQARRALEEPRSGSAPPS